ncbi:hypothetical protein [Saccharothrix sp.]|uniref:hypothetical protein n=1 Tax=Saccharothrix sp. TaxID=1873460 RepID=UPI002811C534|nr:hypothetical protein [Saccharothrix sp.]
MPAVASRRAISARSGPDGPTAQPVRSTAPDGVTTQTQEISGGNATLHGCQAPSTSAAEPAGNRTRNTVSTFGAGTVENSKEVTTPKLPPPPPRNAQNRSGARSAAAVTRRLSTVTTRADRSQSHVRPYVLSSQPKPPPSVNPAIPTEGQLPSGRQRPAAASAA